MTGRSSKVTATRFGWTLALLAPVALLGGTCLQSGGPAQREAATAEAPLESRSQNAWVKQRVQSLATIYNISAEGRAWLDSYDLRQIIGRPGWFGSHGYDGWAGVGQAIPTSLLHEVSHSYFGAFPVTGFASLSWERGPAGGLSPAMEQYHADLARFMSQPSDRYEPLRNRLRNLPHLSREEDPDLYHFGEADLLLTTGGSRRLIPPILLKYFDPFLAEGGFESWEAAFGWYLGLPPDERELADGYLGFFNMPARAYINLTPWGTPRLRKSIKTALETEERQRLEDLAQQFDVIKANELGLHDAAEVDGSFQFWRGYLRDMLRLHKKHPDVLPSAGGQGPRLEEVLSRLAVVEGLPHRQQVEELDGWPGDPFRATFLVVLHDRVLIELLGSAGDALAADSRDGAVDSFVHRLGNYAGKLDGLLATGRKDIGKGPLELERFLQGHSDQEQEKYLGLVFELMRDTDMITARGLVDGLSDGLVIRLLHNNPGALRNGNISPDRLIRALKVTPQDSPGEIVAGLLEMFTHSSGSFQIDEPVTLLAFGVVSDVAEKDPATGLRVLRESKISLPDLIRAMPGQAARMLASDLSEAARIVANPNGFAYAPAHAVHRLISADPGLAARLVAELERQGRDDLAVESVIVFAFDASRIRSHPSLALSLAADREFLEHLANLKGDEWLKSHIVAAISKYQIEVAEAGIDETFVDEYRSTLGELVNTGLGQDSEDLKRTINEALTTARLPPIG